MRHRTIVLAATTAVLVGSPAFAAVDYGDGTCLDETSNTVGVWNGTTGDDAGCVTAAEYEASFSPPGLLAAGVISDYRMISDSEAIIRYAATGVEVVVAYSPMDRPLAATPTAEPNAPTVGEWWRSVTATRTFLRLEHG